MPLRQSGLRSRGVDLPAGDYTFELVFGETRLRAGLSDEEILELTYVTTLYEMHATICRALRLEYDDVDERVTEVEAADGAATDVMRMVDS